MGPIVAIFLGAILVTLIGMVAYLTAPGLLHARANVAPEPLPTEAHTPPRERPTSFERIVNDEPV